MFDPLTRAIEHAKDGTPTDEDAKVLATEVERLRALFTPAEEVDVEEVLRPPPRPWSQMPWRDIEAALNERPALAREVASLREDLDATRRDRAEARATLAAVEAILSGAIPVLEGLAPCASTRIPLARQRMRERDEARGGGGMPPAPRWRNCTRRFRTGGPMGTGTPGTRAPSCVGPMRSATRSPCFPIPNAGAALRGCWRRGQPTRREVAREASPWSIHPPRHVRPRHGSAEPERPTETAAPQTSARSRALSVRCDRCGAPPGEPCDKRTLGAHDYHGVRVLHTTNGDPQ